MCSDECRFFSRKATVKRGIEKQKQKYQATRQLECICEMCQIVFTATKSKTRFCSDKCRWLVSSKKQSELTKKFRNCLRCGIQVPMKCGYAVCDNCKVDKRDPVKAREVERRRRFRRYGITEDQYNLMFEAQGGQCAICKTLEPTSKGWQIDHCHSSLKVRGILCHHCNTALGSFSDDVSRLKSAIDYLKRFDV
jgi:hypothetical protein